MTKLENKSKQTFDKYNPSDAVVRCPNGRAEVRKLLDSYARAATNLYGVISVKELADIFNSQNDEKTDAKEIFTLLLPLVFKSKRYCFYKNVIVYHWAIDDFRLADYWLNEQEGKSRFVPGRDEFLKYEDEYYEDEKQSAYWQKLREFIYKAWPDNIERYAFYYRLKDTPVPGAAFSALGKLLESHGLIFKNEKQLKAFYDLYTQASNNSRLRENKGYTPNELRELMNSLQPKHGPDEIVFQPRVKVGQNDPCPCGSGKKYKKCCSQIEQARTSQLTQRECALFYETWYGLMSFINEEKQIIEEEILPVYPNTVGDERIYKIREALWENPKLIDEYIDSFELSDEEIELLCSWRDRHKKASFFVVDYTPDVAVLLGSDNKKKDILYGVKGISRPLSDAMQRKLPIICDTVLLPFKDKIIYDSFMSTSPVDFGDNAVAMFKELYDKALKHGIITKL